MSCPWPMLALLAAMLLPASPSRADVIVLTTGDRIEGEVVRETDQEVAIRRRFGDSNILYVENFPRAAVMQITRAAIDSRPAEAPATQPEEPAPLQRASEITDPRLFLRKTIDKWSAGQRVAAANDMTHLLTSVKPRELDKLSGEFERELQMSIAQWSAYVHWTTSRMRSKNGPLHLVGVTPYEIAAIVPMLTAEFEMAVREPVRVREPQTRPAQHPAARRPASRPATAPAEGVSSEAMPPATIELSIANWLDRPNELNATRSEAAALCARLVYASSLINERIRIDPAVHRDRALQTALVAQRLRLIGLLRTATERASGGVSADARAAENERRRQEIERRQQELQESQRRDRTQHQTMLSKALRMAQEQARQDAAGAQQTAAAPRPQERTPFSTSHPN